MMTVTVKFFAIARDISKTSDLSLSMPENATAEELLDEITRKFPGLSGWKPYLRLALNCSYVSSAAPLHDGDEVAVIPPVSGG